MSNNEYLFIKRPKLAIVISLVIIFAGILLLKNIPLEEYPAITPPQVVITATYSGASADVIESTIAAPIEAQLNGIENMIYMSSTSQTGSYKLTLYFPVGTDVDMSVVNVQNQLQLVIPRLPEQVRQYGLSVRKSTGGPGLVMISITSPNNSYSNLFLSNYADIYIKDELARIKGVGQVSVFGSSSYSMRIWLKPDRMSTYGISVSDVITAVKNQNAQLPMGDLGVEPLVNKQMIKLTMRTKGRLTTPEEFENIIIRAMPMGGKIKLGDIATVELGAEDYSFFSRINGKESPIIVINQLPNANAINLSNKISDKMKELSKSFPKDLTYNIQHDETKFVRISIKEVVEAVLLAVILVSIITYLFIGTIKASSIPFFAIPVSLIGVFIFIKLFNFSINLLVLFALVLAVGIVVDDAIVVLENTQRHINEGKDSIESTELTMKEVFSAVIITSLVLVAVFVPASFVGGITGSMYRQFALCISSSICLSSVVALTLTPALCSSLLANKESKIPKFILVFNNLFEKLKLKYIDISQYFVTNYIQSFIILCVFSLVSIILFLLIPKGFLPTEDRGVLFTQIQLPDGSSASRTDNLAKIFEKEIKKLPGVKSVITLVGMNGENTAFVISDLESWNKRKNKELASISIMRKINLKFNSYPDATIATFLPPAISGLGMFGGFEYQLLDKGDHTIFEFYNMAQKLISDAKNNPKFEQLYTSFSPNLPQLLIDIDYEKAISLGVSIDEIYNTFSLYFGKTYINDFNKFGRVYRVYTQAISTSRESISDLSKIDVINKEGKMVPLLDLIKVKKIVGPYSTTRFNMYPSIQINGTTAKNVSSGDGINQMEKLSQKILSSGYGFAWSGTSLQEKESQGKFILILVLSLIFVYLFLVGLYESWFLPLGVLFIAPLAIFGALFFQYITGYSFDIYSQIGLIMLVGLSTKQAILVIEFANNMDKNIDPQQRAIEAGSLRFRAVMMTNISFILGLLPLVFAHGAGAESRHSVGITVFGGTCAATFLGTIFTPAFYVFTEKLKENLKSLVRGYNL